MNVNSEIYITDNVIWFHSLCLKFCIKKKIVPKGAPIKFKTPIKFVCYSG